MGSLRTFSPSIIYLGGSKTAVYLYAKAWITSPASQKLHRTQKLLGRKDRFKIWHLPVF